MDEVFVDLRKYDLADRLKLDLISVEALFNRLEDALDEIDRLKIELNETSKSDEEKYDDYLWEQADRINDERKINNE